MRSMASKTVPAAVLMMLFLMARSVQCDWDFWVWNGLNDELQVDDEVPKGPGNFIQFTRGESGLSDYDELVFMTPDPHEEKNADCEAGVHLLRPEFKFHDHSEGGNDGYVVYVFKSGFFAANDNTGSGTPLYTWPSQCILA